ncbi:MAG: MFS transporter [Propioniciclava sp.]
MTHREPRPLSPTLVRARNATLVVFAVSGLALASWMARVPDIKNLLDLTPGSLGILLLALSVGSLLGLPTAGRLATRFGVAGAIRLGSSISLAGLLAAALTTQYLGSMYLSMLGLFLVGLGLGVWDVSVNLEGTRVEQALRQTIMPWFHAAFSGGTVLGVLIGAAMVWWDVSLVLHLGVAAGAGAAAVWWATAGFLVTEAKGPATADAPDIPQTSAWLEPRTLLIGLVVAAAAFAEGTANDWLAVAFVDGHGVSNALGVLALAIFLAFMTAGRILGTQLLDRYGRVTVLIALFTAALVGCLLVIFGTTGLAYLGAAIWGLGASLGFPVGVSAAADDPSRAAARLSVVATIGYTAFLAGPPLLGFLGDHYGVLPALLAVGAMSAIALFIVPVTRPPE